MNRKKLNILQVINSPWWHAISEYALGLSKGLKAKGHKVIIATLPGSFLIKRAEAENLPIVTDLRLNHYNPFYLFDELRKMVRLLEEKEIDVLNVHESYGFVISCLAAKLAKRPIALIRTRGTFMTPKGHPLNRYLHNTLADKVIVTSKFMREKCLKHLKGKESHYLLIYGGIDTENIKLDMPDLALKESLGIESDAEVIGIIARFDPIKGYPYFFEAAGKVKTEVNGQEAAGRVKFLVIGYEGEFSTEEILTMAENCGVKEETIVINKWVNLPEMLSIIDIGVIASIGSEANSRVTFEFMACGKPIVSTTVGVIPEIIEDGKTGYLVKPKDTQAMAEVLVKLLKDKARCDSIGSEAQKLVQEKFQEKILVEQTEEIYYQEWEKKLPIRN
ncbi:MAG: glycosyltransferase family 4 protein [bacterium]|nr:glycosyltransferase family 4 protein [bacterium]